MLGNRLVVPHVHVAPVVRYEQRFGRPHIEPIVYGTAFFANSEGHFLTATHVAIDLKSVIEAKGGNCGLLTLQSDRPDRLKFRPIERFDFQPHPADVAVGRVFLEKGQRTQAAFSFERWLTLDPPDEVHLLGFPYSAASTDEAMLTTMGCRYF